MVTRKVTFAFVFSVGLISFLQIAGTGTDVQANFLIEKAQPIVRAQLSESFSITGVERTHSQLHAEGAGVGILVIDDWSKSFGVPHGESVRSIVQATAPEADVWLCKLDFTQASMADFLGCFREMETRKLPVQIVNMSFSMGEQFYPDACGTNLNEFGREIHRLAQKGIIFVAASDNQGVKTGLRFPACQEEVISVGATYDFNGGELDFMSGNYSCSDTVTLDKITCYSNTAKYLDVLAPGTSINTSVTKGFGGTSASAPIVTGIIAMMLSVDDTLNASQIRQTLKKTGKSVFEEHLKMSFPRVDAYSALESVSQSFSSTFSNVSQQNVVEFDLDRNGHIDDSEFFRTVDLWISERIDSLLFFEVIDAWTSQVTLQGIAGKRSYNPTFHLQSTRESLLFSATLDAERVEITIYDGNGQPVYHEKAFGRSLRWDLRSDERQRVANGIYIYVFVIESEAKSIRESGRIAILR